ncbi:putative leucine-rich repeat receptor-like protein kinase [Dorcoceras hygrometricum]|uniref:Putative leucine-rich repeat receptor-like protein kinase n=1 Tax=Dorcoceras hygrometricum TaxID=472368 RepID=A0A2Z7AAI5_9LAMI|nr:putative leucine-rich repeat receptor-like protein kinase [Dorcoceras hygrometricum]
MPPRRGRSRRSEGSRAPDSDEDVHQVDDVTRRLGGMELVLARFQRTNPPNFAATEGGARAEAWLVQMEELFDTLEYAPKKRLKLAVYSCGMTCSAGGEALLGCFVIVEQ